MPYEYEVAISFLARDEPLARQLQEALVPMPVFVYSKAQEKLAGRDGVEAFREVFRSKARVAVVLFRPGWGQTPWTRVEETAIKDYCLDVGWDHLMFVQLEKGAARPTWVPDAHLYLDLQSFGIAELVGAIKAQCARLGASLSPPSAADRAKQIAANARLQRETEQLLFGSVQPLDEAAATLFAATEQRLSDVARATNWSIEMGYDRKEFVASVDGISIQLLTRWIQRESKALLTFRLFDGQVPTPQQRSRGLYPVNEPVERRKREFKLVRRLELGWCWEYQGRILTTEALADEVANDFVSAKERAGQS